MQFPSLHRELHGDTIYHFEIKISEMCFRWNKWYVVDVVVLVVYNWQTIMGQQMKRDRYKVHSFWAWNIVLNRM